MTVALTFAIVQNGMPMKFVDLISYYHIPYVSEKGIAIWKINSEIREEENIPGIDSHAILFVVVFYNFAKIGVFAVEFTFEKFHCEIFIWDKTARL